MLEGSVPDMLKVRGLGVDLVMRSDIEKDDF